MDKTEMKEKSEKAKAYLEQLFGVPFRVNVRDNKRNVSGDAFGDEELYQTQLEFETYIAGPGKLREEAARKAEEEERLRKKAEEEEARKKRKAEKSGE